MLPRCFINSRFAEIFPTKIINKHGRQKDSTANAKARDHELILDVFPNLDDEDLE
jgi:hypothetical protein